MTLLIEVTS